MADETRADRERRYRQAVDLLAQAQATQVRAEALLAELVLWRAQLQRYLARLADGAATANGAARERSAEVPAAMNAAGKQHARDP